VIFLAADASPIDFTFSTGVTLFVVEWLIRIGLVIRVIMRRSTVPVSLAWILILLFLPLLGMFLYLLVGENRLGQHGARRAADISAELEAKALAIWKATHDDWAVKAAGFTMLAKLGTTVSGLPPLRGNALELYGDAHSLLDALIKDIDASRSHCHLCYYIWMPRERGVSVAEALIRAAERGVSCRVLVDAVGAMAFLRSDLPERMRAAGVRVVEALPVNPLRMLLARMDLRNHRKLAVIDGQIGYCGSQNVTDETYRYRRRRRKSGPWLDATLRIRGPAVTALQTVFLADWLQDSEENIEGVEAFLHPCPPAGDQEVHVIPSGPGSRTDAVHQAFLTLLHSAREELVMTTPYFVPDEATKAALINAALRGVRVTLVVPDRLDAYVVAAAGRAHFDDLLAVGVHVMEHTEGLLHAKTITVDRKVAVVTSANFDVRSFWLNFEATVMVYDERSAREVFALQSKYISESEQIDLASWRRRPLWRQFLENTARLFGPLL